MRNDESWKRFEETGGIREYLDYTACTREGDLDYKKEKQNDPNGYCNRDCVSSNANR